MAKGKKHGINVHLKSSLSIDSMTQKIATIRRIVRWYKCISGSFSCHCAAPAIQQATGQFEARLRQLCLTIPSCSHIHAMMEASPTEDSRLRGEPLRPGRVTELQIIQQLKVDSHLVGRSRIMAVCLPCLALGGSRHLQLYD